MRTYRNLKVAQNLGMETIRKLTAWFLGHSYLDKPPKYHILKPSPDTDVPIGDSLGAIKRLEEKLGIDLTSDCEDDSRASHKL